MLFTFLIIFISFLCTFSGSNTSFLNRNDLIKKYFRQGLTELLHDVFHVPDDQVRLADSVGFELLV